jgi:hypothetical protein
VQRDFQPFARHKGRRKALLRQELALIEVLVRGFRVMMKQKQLFDLRLQGQVYHVFPGTMPPALLAVADLGAAVLRIVNQQIDPHHSLQHLRRALRQRVFVVRDISDPQRVELEHIA